jgi:hypothetical protein
VRRRSWTCLRLTAAILLMLGVSVAQSINRTAVSVEITGVEPEANYEPTKDGGDLAQLADGRLSSYPIWTRAGSVGWVRKSPVSIMARAKVQEGKRYTLSVRTAVGSAAGVFPPRRIDVYCRKGPASIWQHAGASQRQVGPRAADNVVVDLKTSIVGCGGDQLRAVLHADGSFVMIDEVSLQADGDNTGSGFDGYRGPQAGQSIRDAVSDSLRRLEHSLLASASAEIRRAAVAASANGRWAWLADPWSDVGKLNIAARSHSLGLSVLPGGSASYIVGIANPGRESRRFFLSPDPRHAGATTVSALRPGLAADGQLVFDVVEPGAKSDLTVEPEGIRYLLLTELDVGVAGARRVTVKNEAGDLQELAVTVQLLDQIRPGIKDKPRVLVWAYTNDQPIWRNDTAFALAAELASAGVNVFDIHPRHIPAPLDEADWPSRAKALAADLALFRGKGIVLLFLGGDPWNTLTSLPDDPATTDRLARWISMLKRVMRDGGFEAKDWALYPVDEPNGDNLDKLADLVIRLRGIDPTLQFYANPSIGRSELMLAVPSLWRLTALVDFWQPRAGATFDMVATLLRRRGRPPAWVYDNPRSPARSAPPGCYRAFAGQAFDSGASGLGFWSFSNTNDSSAWTDFDGTQPDWAVVYEAKSGFATSRRWEAFKQGITDFSALSYCARNSRGGSKLQSHCAIYRHTVDAVSRDGCED